MTFELATDIEEEVSTFLLALADDDFFTANRLARWVGSGPTLEEDNALSAIQQDEMGHARLWYEVVTDFDGRSLDELALGRPAGDRRNSVLVEPDHRDFADTVVRSALYDPAERLLVRAVRDGEVEELCARAEQVLHEEHYHREHADRWLDVLTCTDEGRRRIVDAFETNLPNAQDYFTFDGDLAETLVEERVVARPLADLRAEWTDAVASTVEELPVDLNAEDVRAAVDGPPNRNGRAGEHTEAFEDVIADLYPTPEELYPEEIHGADDLRYAEKVGLADKP